MNAYKLTDKNFLPTKNNVMVRAEHFNTLVDDVTTLEERVDAILPSDGTLNADVITEETAGAGVKVETVQMLDGGIRHANLVSFHGAFVNEAIQQDLTTTFAGPNTAIDTATYFTAITTGAGGANAITLAASSIPGVLKKIALAVDAADAVITVAGSTGLTTITLNDAGDYVLLVAMQDLGWRCIENNGATLA